MNPDIYTKFLSKGLPPTDPLSSLMSLQTDFMRTIALTIPHQAQKIGIKIDLLIGVVALQHMEAAVADPVLAKEAIRMMREHLMEKAKKVLD
jgi:hypothetical protein